MNITIVGAGKSGIAAALLAQRDGDTPTVVDQQQRIAPESQLALDNAGIRVITSNSATEFVRTAQQELMIVSPGVPPSSEFRTLAASRNIPVIGELEYATQHLKNNIVAITGTNGKTTTTALTTHILVDAGLKAISAGNIGTPLSALVGTLDADTIIVAETSSYQLDTTTAFKPLVAVILNITPDHLSYHGSFEEYSKSKWKIFANQDASDTLILNADDAHVNSAAPVARSTVRQFSVGNATEGAFVWGDNIVLRDQQQIEEILMPVRKLGLPGVHNQYNSMAATLAARALEVQNEQIRGSLASFGGVEHRLEYVRTLHGVRYINDSKATNINATWYALSSYTNPLIWLAGGRGDNNDYTALDELVAKHVQAIVCIGEEREAIFNHWCTTKRCVKAESMDAAVLAATELAHEDSIVLFSPACKSYDMFNNFEERGQAFKQAVLNL